MKELITRESFLHGVLWQFCKREVLKQIQLLKNSSKHYSAIFVKLVGVVLLDLRQVCCIWVIFPHGILLLIRSTRTGVCVCKYNLKTKMIVLLSDSFWIKFSLTKEILRNCTTSELREMTLFPDLFGEKNNFTLYLSHN